MPLDEVMHGGASSTAPFQGTTVAGELYNQNIFISSNMYGAITGSDAQKTGFPYNWVRVYMPFYSSKNQLVYNNMVINEGTTGDMMLALDSGTANVSNTSHSSSSSTKSNSSISLIFTDIINDINATANFTVKAGDERMSVNVTFRNTTSTAVNASSLKMTYNIDVGGQYYEAQDVINVTIPSTIYTSFTEGCPTINYTDNQLGYCRNEYIYISGRYYNSLNHDLLSYDGSTETIPGYSFRDSNLAPGCYMVWAYLRAHNSDLYYNMSFDGQTWFLINGNSNNTNTNHTRSKVYLGMNCNVTDGTFLQIADAGGLDSGEMMYDGFAVS